MKVLLSLILLALLGFGIFWYLKEGQHRTDVRQAEQDILSGAERMKEAVKDKVGNLSFRSEDIKEELSRSGSVIRRKAKELSSAIADTAADAKVTTAIKAKLVADPDLSAWNISVSTTAGVVTLSGSVQSYEQIGKAMRLALETEGAHEVISTLQVRLAGTPKTE